MGCSKLNKFSERESEGRRCWREDVWLWYIWRQNAKHPQYLQPRKGNFRLCGPRKTIIKSFVIFLNTTHSSVKNISDFFCKITLSQHIYFVAISVNRFHWQHYLLKTSNCQQNEFGVNFYWIYIILIPTKSKFSEILCNSFIIIILTN